MNKEKLEKLVSFENNHIYIEGENLSHLANMYFMSVADYLDLCRLYLSVIDLELDYGYHLNQTSSQTKDGTCCCKFTRYGEILVPESGYEDLKKKLFNLAYACCSDIEGKEIVETRKNIEVYDHDFGSNLANPLNYSSCYKSLNGKWEQILTSSPIDLEDREKRYSIIKR